MRVVSTVYEKPKNGPMNVDILNITFILKRRRLLMSKVFEEVFNRAVEAGNEAMKAAVPRAMTVSNPASGESWYVEGGVCGFAWVNVKPGNCRFANWAKKNTKFKPDSYEGGVKYWVSEGGQSMERKEAFARAMSKVLTDAGVARSVYSGSRMD